VVFHPVFTRLKTAGHGMPAAEEAVEEFLTSVGQHRI
jgi:hypothetical protein